MRTRQQGHSAQPNLTRTQRDQLLAVMAFGKPVGGGWDDEMKSHRI